MRRLILPERLPKSLSRPIALDEGESNHLRTVLRVPPNEIIEALDGEGGVAKGYFRPEGKRGFFEPIEERKTYPQRESLPIRLTLATIKADAMEWAIEKATELRARDLVPVVMDYSVVQTHKKDPDHFRERWQRISDQSLKQCGRTDLMKIHTPLPFEDHLKSLGARLQSSDHHLFWCDERSIQLSQRPSIPKSIPSIEILIGPEGGFSPKEQQWLEELKHQYPNRVHALPLGPIILRAETAVVSALSLLGYSWEINQYGN